MKIKSLFFTALFLLSTQFTHSSYLNLSLFDGSEFLVVLDGYNLIEPGNYAEFDGLDAGEHDLVVYRNSPKLEDYIFRGKIKIPYNTCVFAVIDEYGSFLIYRKIASSGGKCSFECNSPSWKKCGSKEKWDDKKKPDEICFNRMSDEDFKDLKKTMNNRNFESTNIDIAKTALHKNLVSSEQVRELLGYYTFETSKLEIAKYAYTRTCDKKNYFKVYDAFGFESSVNELKDYIKDK